MWGDGPYSRSALAGLMLCPLWPGNGRVYLFVCFHPNFLRHFWNLNQQPFGHKPCFFDILAFCNALFLDRTSHADDLALITQIVHSNVKEPLKIPSHVHRSESYRALKSKHASGLHHLQVKTGAWLQFHFWIVFLFTHAVLAAPSQCDNEFFAAVSSAPRVVFLKTKWL